MKTTVHTEYRGISVGMNGRRLAHHPLAHPVSAPAHRPVRSVPAASASPLGIVQIQDLSLHPTTELDTTTGELQRMLMTETLILRLLLLVLGKTLK